MVTLDKNTELTNFPGIYNANNTELLNKISELNTKIVNLEKKHKEDIATLLAKIVTLTAKIEEK